MTINFEDDWRVGMIAKTVLAGDPLWDERLVVTRVPAGRTINRGQVDERSVVELMLSDGNKILKRATELQFFERKV